MKRTHYVIRTAKGYVGAWSIPGPETDDMPKQLAWTYTDRAQADAVARLWSGTVETL